MYPSTTDKEVSLIMHWRHNLYFDLHVHSSISVIEGRRLCTPGLEGNTFLRWPSTFKHLWINWITYMFFIWKLP